MKNEHLLYVGMDLEKNTSIFLQLHSLKLTVGAFPKRELVFLLKGLKKKQFCTSGSAKYIATHTCHIYRYIYIHIVYTNIHIIYGIYTATYSCATICKHYFLCGNIMSARKAARSAAAPYLEVWLILREKIGWLVGEI